MYWLKGCPRCRGDLHNDRDSHGTYMACLQCGHYLTPEEELVLLALRLDHLEPAGRYSAAASLVPSRSVA